MKNELPDFEFTFFEGLVKRDPRYVEALIPLAELYTKMGLYEKGLEIDRRLAELKKDDAVIHYNLACSYALVNQPKQAFKALTRAIRLGYRDFEYMKRDRDLVKLHAHPEFQRLTQAGKNKK